MSPLRLTIASLRYHWRTNLVVACGVAVATAVLTGALLVGDSMRGSLRQLTLDRLGRIDQALVSDHFFRAALAEEIRSRHAPRAVARGNGTRSVPDTLETAPAILLNISVEREPPSLARARRVALVGCDDRFWRLGSGRPHRLPPSREIVLNRPLADELDVGRGDTVLLRLPRPSAIPSDTALGRKQETVRTLRATVSEVIEPEGLGRFGLRPTQRVPHNAYVSLEWLQEQLLQPGGANAILAAGTEGVDPLQVPVGLPQLSDYGLHVEHTPRGYWNITSDRMLLDARTERAVLQAIGSGEKGTIPISGTVPIFAGTDAQRWSSKMGLSPSSSGETAKSHPDVQLALTYLANTLACRERSIPYSTITAIDFADHPPLGPFVSADGKPLPPLGPGEIALNTWAADDLRAKVGDPIRISYFEPESIDGQVREATVSLRLAAVVRLSDAADDRALTPTVKGLTDERTIADWDPPFPFHADRIRPEDEKYWDRYGPTPKAFVSLAVGQELWGSRFGQTTSLRVAERHNRAADIAEQLRQRLDPAAMGLVFQPVRRQGLEAAAGTTPFGVLFLCFSFFLLAAAAMLVALLFRLGVEQRAAQLGALFAVGLSRRQVARLLLGEAAAVAAIGSLLGVPLGIGYAALLLFGLRTWWLPAIGTPLVRLHFTTASLTIGAAAGVVIAMAVIWLSVRRLSRLPPRRLLSGETATNRLRQARTSARRGLEAILLLIAVAPTIVLLLLPSSEQGRAGAFFLSGAAALLALLALVTVRLRSGRTGPAVAVGRGNLLRMAMRNAARNPGRSTLSVGLMAAATFLIVAVSAFRVDPRGQTPSRDSGNGGFALVAESDQPIFANLGTPQGRGEIGFSADDEKAASASSIVSMRLRSGDDASCLNLYRPRQPRVLGVPPAMIRRGGFAWADAPKGVANPWELLDSSRHAPRTAAVPVILDKNTANYSLHLWGGLGETFEIEDERGRPLRLQVVALLADSIFQGDLLIGEQAFLEHFPNTSGQRFFLVETPPEQTPAVRRALENTLSDYGFAAETTPQRMASLMTVQNTYLLTFQSLGGLGLLLGTIGLATVQLRSVLERRGELALLRATGFRRRRVATLVLLEHGVLLTAGLAVGLIAALLAVLPQLAGRVSAPPWFSLTATLVAIWIVGLAAGMLAVRAVLRAPLLVSLREGK